MNGEGVNEGLEWLIETLNTAQAGGAEAGAAAQQEEVKQWKTSLECASLWAAPTLKGIIKIDMTNKISD